MIKMTTESKQDNIIFMEGKELGLKTLFSQNQGCFGYLAVGHNPAGTPNGFVNVDEENNETSSNGFYELSVEEDSTYRRVPLTPHGEPIYNEDNGEVTVKFLAEFDVDNIVSGVTIDQIAIVNTETPNDPSTIYYAAATCDDDFNKSEQLAIGFIIEMTI